MLRAAAWTGGLFALGGGICHLFPGPWVEPLVLLGLGTTLADAYPADVVDRLAAVKQRVDPDGIFRSNRPLTRAAA